MALSMFVVVEYEGSDKILTASPVFDSINLPVEIPGKLVGGASAVQFITFFLVYKNSAEKSFMWVQMERCNIKGVSSYRRE